MENWKTVRLGHVCEILNGYAFKSDKYVDSGIRVIRITNVQKGFIEDNSPAFYPITEKENLKDYELYENDLLISLTGNVGRVALLSKEMLPAALNQRVGCIRIRDKNLLISYLFTFLNSDKFESDCIYSARGIAQKNMSTEWLKNYLIPLPPIEVQIKIANNLNTCAKIIKKHNKQLNNFDLLIKSRFIEMFGDPVQNPMGWEKTELGNLCKEVRYGTSKPASENGKYTYLRMNNITYEGELDLTNIKSIDISDDELPKCSVKKGDILFNRTNSIELCGKTCLYKLDETMVIAGYIIRVRVNEKLNPQYVSTFFNTKSIKKLLKEMAKGAVNQANINAQEMQSIQIPVPPISLQNEYESFVQQIDKSKFAVQKSLEKAETLYKSLMQEYFG